MNLKRLIFEIQKEVIKSGIPDINSGGCGYFAFFVANELDKFDIPYTIRMADDECSVETKKSNLNDEPDGYLLACEHIWLEINSDRVFKFDCCSSGADLEDRWEKRPYLGEFNKEDLKQIIRLANWNKDYQTANNKQLRQIIKEAFINMAMLSRITQF